ncbi:MAG: hypothetical protein ACO1N0_00030 [Fluviicola sp.]
MTKYRKRFSFLDFLSIGCFIGSFFSFFTPEVSESGSTLYYNYGTVACLLILTLLFGIISNTKVAKMLVLLSSAGIVLLNCFIAVHFSPQFSGLDFIIYSIIAGIAAWIASGLLILRFNYSLRKKGFIFLFAAVFFVLVYLFMIYYRIFWDDLSGSILIWLICANGFLITCSGIYLKQNALKQTQNA